jgi:hypothetical protein
VYRDSEINRNNDSLLECSGKKIYEMMNKILVKTRKVWECVDAEIVEGEFSLKIRPAGGSGGEAVETVDLGKIKQVNQCGRSLIELPQESASSLDSLDSFVQDREHRFFIHMFVFEIVLQDKSMFVAVQKRHEMNHWISTLGKIFIQFN